jgi:hypothetical protein
METIDVLSRDRNKKGAQCENNSKQIYPKRTMVVMAKERNARFKPVCGYSLHYELSTDIKYFLVNRTAILVTVCTRSDIFSTVN